eukprot:1142871-Pelagomonas_calceolata.AAC.1
MPKDKGPKRDNVAVAEPDAEPEAEGETLACAPACSWAGSALIAVEEGKGGENRASCSLRGVHGGEQRNLEQEAQGGPARLSADINFDVWQTAILSKRV